MLKAKSLVISTLHFSSSLFLVDGFNLISPWAKCRFLSQNHELWLRGVECENNLLIECLHLDNGIVYTFGGPWAMPEGL